MSRSDEVWLLSLWERLGEGIERQGASIEAIHEPIGSEPRSFCWARY